MPTSDGNVHVVTEDNIQEMAMKSGWSEEMLRVGLNEATCLGREFHVWIRGNDANS